MKSYIAVGLSVLAGAALFEAALIPGILIGGAAVLAPQYLPKLRRRPEPRGNSMNRRRSENTAAVADRRDVKLPMATRGGLRIKQAVTKTITFRIIVTTLDFTTNYVVIGEFAAAAGLSAFGLVAGPLFYLAHETAWNYFGPAGTTVELPALSPVQPETQGLHAGEVGITISRALAKTITFRTIATVMDFTANYVVVGELATAAGLSAFAFVVGPFVYLGHEKIWDHIASASGAARPVALLSSGSDYADGTTV